MFRTIKHTLSHNLIKLMVLMDGGHMGRINLEVKRINLQKDQINNLYLPDLNTRVTFAEKHIIERMTAE